MTTPSAPAPKMEKCSGQKETKDVTNRARFTKPKRYLDKCVNRHTAEYYIKALLYYVFTRKSSIIKRDDFLQFIDDLPNENTKCKTFTSKTYDGKWGIFTKYPHNWAARFNISILIRCKQSGDGQKAPPNEESEKRHFYLTDQFTRRILHYFPQFRETWQHRPEGKFTEYKCSRQYYRYLRSQKNQRDICKTQASIFKTSSRKASLYHRNLKPDTTNHQVQLKSIQEYFDQVYQDIQEVEGIRSLQELELFGDFNLDLDYDEEDHDNEEESNEMEDQQVQEIIHQLEHDWW